MKPVELVRYGRFASRVEGFRGWRALSAGLTWGGQPLRWRLSGDSDAMWLDRCGEDTDRPVFHTLTEQLLADATVRLDRDGVDPDEVGGAYYHRLWVGIARYASPKL